MKRFFLTFAMAACLLAPASAAMVSFPVNQFGGINTDDDPLTLKKNTPDSLNVVTDNGQGVEGRKGFISRSTDTATAMWELPHSNGNRYLIKWSDSEDRLEASLDGITFNIAVATTADGVPVSGAVLGDAFYFTNTTDGLKKITFSGNTATLAIHLSTLTFSQIASWKGRIWGVGKSGSERILFGSAYTNGTSWTLSSYPDDTSPTQRTISGAFDEPITALFASPFDTLMWFKAHSFGAVYGSNYNNFSQKVLSETAGTSYPETIRECDGYVRFMGPNRTIWEYKGGLLRPENRITDSIDDLMATFSQGDAGSRQYAISTQAEFAAGTSLYVSTTIAAGSVVLSTWTDGDSSSSEFASGTYSNTQYCSYQLYSMSASGVCLSTTNTNILDYSFEPPNEGDDWTFSGVTANGIVLPTYVTPTNAKDGGYVSILDKTGTTHYDTYTLEVLYPTSDTAWYTHSYTATDNEWTQRTIPFSTIGPSYFGTSVMGRMARIRIKYDAEMYFVSDPFMLSGSDMTYWDNHHIIAPSTVRLVFDLFEGGVSTVTTGSYVSQVFDTAITTPAWIQSESIRPSASISYHNSAIYTRVSSNSANWDSYQLWGTGAEILICGESESDYCDWYPRIPSASKRYLQYKWEVSTGATGEYIPYIFYIDMAARSSTGSWVSPSVQTTGMSAHDVFTANGSLDGGTISFVIYGDTDSTKTILNGVPVASSYVTSQTITDTAIPSIATAAYVFVGANFAITASTQDPQLDDMTVKWKTGSTVRAASAYYDQRYWLSLAANSTTNNRILVFDRNREWQLYSGINADSLALYNGSLVFGNSSGLFQAETGYDDNGTAITAYYTSPTYAPAGIDIWTALDMLYMTTTNSESDMSTSYFLDGKITEHSMGPWAMNTTTGYQNFKLPFSMEGAQKSKYVKFKWTVTGSDAWKILNANIYYQPDPIPE